MAGKLGLLAIALLSYTVDATTSNYSSYVDLFIGSQGTVADSSYNGGNVFPGASLPFGVVKNGIDTTESVIPCDLKPN